MATPTYLQMHLQSNIKYERVFKGGKRSEYQIGRWFGEGVILYHILHKKLISGLGSVTTDIRNLFTFTPFFLFFFCSRFLLAIFLPNMCKYDHKRWLVLEPESPVRMDYYLLLFLKLTEFQNK